MQRILILGNCGAGKSTLAVKLGKVTKLPVFHLDRYFWKPNWVEPDQDSWRKVLKELLKSDFWIMDGNHSNSLDMRIPRSDLIILLDFPTMVCLWRVLKRRIKAFYTDQTDVAEGCPEKFDFEFYKWVWDYKSKRFDITTKFIEKHNASHKVVVLNSQDEIECFLIKMDEQFVKTAGQ